MKTNFLRSWLSLVLVLAFIGIAQAQNPATRTVILGIGRGTCTGGTQGVQQFTYNAATNYLDQIGSICQPSLGSSAFSIFASVIDYNPKDGMLYYFKRVERLPSTVPKTYDTYVWRWAPGTCPTGSLAPLSIFSNSYLTVAFDAAGNGWMINLSPQATVPVTNLLTMRKVDFTTSTLGPIENITLPAGVNIYTTNGDYLITPGGNMFFAYDNKLLTVNYQDYGVSPLSATYIDTIPLPSAGQSLIGLSYANGEFVGSFVKTTATMACGYGEVNMLTGDQGAITRPVGETFTSFDNSSVTSGIGIAKKFISATPTATPGRYTVVYDVFVKNYGNYPVSSIQVIDSLQFINGIGNVVAGSVSTAFISNPAGLTINTGYNGTTNARLLNIGQTLVNTPAANNNFTIRITADITGIIPGIIYYNSAVATGTGFNTEGLRDSSVNGTNPDLNLNEKPDDFGEGVKTPFVITVASETPPCGTLATVLHNQNFNTASNQSTMPAGSTSQYTGSLTAPLANERFVITNNPSLHNSSYWNAISDHGGGGRMMIINADVNNSVIYSATINGLCANLKYSFSAWVANISNASQLTFCNAVGGFKYPKLNFRVKDAGTGVILTNISSGDISSNSWTEYGMRFVLPTGYTNLTIEIINEGEGGCGNDIAIDDIKFGLCDPAPAVVTSTVSSGCIGGSTTFSASLNDPTVISGTIEYQWQESSDNSTFTNIIGAVTATHTIPVLAASHLKYYRVLIASTGSINNSTCRYTSPGFLLTAKTLSTVPTAVAKNKTIFCPGDPVTLQVSGGTFGTNAVYRWYSGTCGSTLVGTGTSITVTPTVSTTYFVRIEGDCNSTTCLSIPVTINCDIDADDDGIPDVVESASIDPKLDDDFDGIPNWRDANYTGFTDTNADGVNDAFDSDKDGIPNFMDRDSDNDGIPDVTEAGGGDSDGNGIIDSYTDTDSDGFSQNVDANASGHTSSGNGLALPDLDGDGIPNYFDLDSDNDGTPDVVEVYGTDIANDGMLDYTGTFASNDTDGDGLLNSVDADANGDGTIDNTNGPLLKTGTILANGRAGSYPNKNMDGDVPANPYDLDSDGDGIADVIEAQFADADFNGRIDGTYNTRGWSTTIAALGSLPLQNRDATGRANMYDIDADDDGIPDNIEGLPTASYLLAVAADADGDGIDNSYDNISGFGGKGITPYNKDGDTFPDYLDTDTDGDGMIDRIEGNDFNLNQRPDDDVSLTGLDTDGDGLDNKFDNDNTSAKCTSAYMGNSGSFSGPASPGSRTMVQLSFPLRFTDRDWRQVDYVLSLDFITFNGTWEGDAARLGWTVNTQQRVAHYEVQRSTDGVHFVTVKKVSAPSGIGMQHLAATDLLSGFNSAIVWYRVKAVSDEGATKLSSLVVLRKSQSTSIIVQILPNPVVTTLSVGVQSNTSVKAQVFIYDNRGSLVHRDAINIVRGYNTFTYPSTAALPNGSYHYHLNAGGYKTVHKFQIQR